MGFLFKNKKEKIVAIFDIGSGSVTGAIAHIPLDGKSIPTIIKSVQSEIKFRQELDFNLFVSDMIIALDFVAQALYNKKLGAVEEIYCVLASPFYLSEIRNIKMAKETSFTFTDRLATDLIQKEISSLTEIYKNKYSNIENTPEVIEKNIISVFLNGYPIEEPLGMKCHSLEINMIISLADKTCLTKIKEILSKIFHRSQINFSSFVVNSYLAVRDKYVKHDSYLLLDISGEITDIGIVNKGVLKLALSFPFGKKTFLRHLCSKMEIELRDAQELLNLYYGNNISSELSQKFSLTLRSIEDLWAQSFVDCVKKLPHTLILPSTIFLTADNDIKKCFVEILTNEKKSKSRIINNKYKLITLDGSEFLKMCNTKESCNPFLMIEAISIMRKYSN